MGLTKTSIHFLVNQIPACSGAEQRSQPVALPMYRAQPTAQTGQRAWLADLPNMGPQSTALLTLPGQGTKPEALPNY